jgi:hypothetical protein
MNVSTVALFSTVAVIPLFEVLRQRRFEALSDLYRADDPSDALALRLSYCDKCKTGYCDLTLSCVSKAEKRSESRLVFSAELAPGEVQAVLERRAVLETA